jgi:phenylalanyl-tRNA synthetase beta chain
MEGRIPAFEPLSKFPSIRRDLAIVLDLEMPYKKVLEVAWAAAPESVKDIQLFDVYTGGNVDSSLKSLALSLILQETSHTLTDQEVDEASARILGALEKELSAKLRD